MFGDSKSPRTFLRMFNKQDIPLTMSVCQIWTSLDHPPAAHVAISARIHSRHFRKPVAAQQSPSRVDGYSVDLAGTDRSTEAF